MMSDNELETFLKFMKSFLFALGSILHNNGALNLCLHLQHIFHVHYILSTTILELIGMHLQSMLCVVVGVVIKFMIWMFC